MKLRNGLKIEKAKDNWYIIDDLNRNIISFGERECMVLNLLLTYSFNKVIEILVKEYVGADIEHDVKKFMENLIELRIIEENEENIAV